MTAFILMWPRGRHLMQYNIHKLEDYDNHEYIRVSGYDDGSDWLFAPFSHKPDQCSVIGDRYFWVTNQNAQFALFDLAKRAKIAAFDFSKNGVYPAQLVVANHKGLRSVFVLQKYAEDKKYVVKLRQISCETGEIIKKIDLSKYTNRSLGNCLVHAEDGKVLVDFSLRPNEHSKVFGIISIDLETGSIEKFEQEDSSEYPYYEGNPYLRGLENPSPCGNYWLKRDTTTFPCKDVNGSGIFSLFQKKRYYGLTYQVWQAKPLKFLKRITVAWFERDHMPGNISFHNVYPQFKKKFGEKIYDGDNILKYQALCEAAFFNATAKACAQNELGPTDCIDWKAYGKEFEPNGQWKGASELWFHLFGQGPGHEIQWQPDSKAFWIRTNGHLSKVTLAGEISKRVMLERFGYMLNSSGGKTSMPEVWGSPRNFWARNDGSVLARAPRGTFVLHGTPSESPYAPIQVPTSKDNWCDHDQQAIDNAKERVKAFKSKAKKIQINLVSLKEEDCVTAINDTQSMIDENIIQRAVNGEIQFVFKIGSKSMNEASFFKHVTDNCPNSVEALRKLIATYTKHGSAELYWKIDPTSGVLCHAVLALTKLDFGSLPYALRYLDHVDPEHEYFFHHKIVPEVLKTHGWTKNTLEFAMVAMFHQHISSRVGVDFWNQHTLSKVASGHFSAEEFAAFIHDAIETYGYQPEEETSFGHPVVSYIAENLKPEHRTQWDDEFFNAFKKLASSKTDEHGLP